MAFFGNLKNPPGDLLCAMGQIDGISTGFKYASSTVVSTSYVDIWPVASVLSYLSSAESMLVSSASGDDAVGGTGLQKIKIFGLDQNYDEIEEEISLNGMTSVASTNSYLRVYRARGIQAGSGGVNAGLITITAASSGTPQAYIATGTNNTLQSQLTVPNGKYLFAESVTITVRSGDQANIRFFVRNFGEIFTLREEFDIVSSSTQVVFSPPIPVPPKSDITARAIKIAGGGNVGITCSYDYYLVDSSLVNV